jgi:predicted O-methyltransferase YrrM
MSLTRTARSTARAAARYAFQRAAAPFGLRQISALQAQGLPAFLVEPLRVLLHGRCPESARSIVDRIERRRHAVAASGRRYRFEQHDSPHGFVRWLVDASSDAPSDASAASAGTHPRSSPVTSPNASSSASPADVLVSSRWLAESVSLNERWGLFLHLCATHASARTILELGACIGISGAYLASSPACTRLITIEGSPAIARLAEETLSDVSLSNRATVIEGVFDDALPRVFERLAAERRTIDFAYVDGHHDYAATLHYVALLKPHLSRGACIVLDDICLYAEMWRAWTEVSAMPGVSAAVHVGRFGILVWDDRASTPLTFDISRYTGRWPIGPARATAIAASRLG